MTSSLRVRGAAHAIVHEDERIVAVDKPAGLASEDVAAALQAKLIHRIDKPTSGLLLLGKDARAVQMMQRALARGEVRREYLLVAHGVVQSERIESLLARDRGDGLRGSAGEGKRAVTDVFALSSAQDGSATLARAVLETGRTHQIRIHLAERGHPLVGERVYVRDRRAAGETVLFAERLLLHAWQLCFTHPVTKAPLPLASPPPPAFVAAASRCVPGANELLVRLVGL
jgi:23S rRNA pseudouridine1911/1915/1917 synthase